MENITRLGFAFGIFFIMAVWEVLNPRRPLQLGRKQRWSINLGLAFSNILLTRFTVGGIAYASAIYAQQQGLGVLNLFNTPYVLAVIITLLVLDFAIYAQHILSHKWAWLWRLHQVHHSDIDIDVTTAVRFHPVEIGLSLIYKILWIFLLGAEPFAVIMFEIILNGTATFNHSNVNIPLKIDKLLRWLIVTPDMHRIHHSTLRIEADSNYGFSISLWDRLFKTYTAEPQNPQLTMNIGLKELRKSQQVAFFKLLVLPFKTFK